MQRYFVLFLFPLLITNCNDSAVPSEVDEAIENLRTAHAPDKRVALWDVEASHSQNRLVLSGETNLPEALNSLKETLMAAGIEAAYEITLLPSEALEGKTYGIVNLSACNIRSEGKHSAELSTQSTLGTIIRILKEVDGWYLVQTPDGYLGWLDSGGFVALDELELEQWKSSTRVVYQPHFGFSYTRPDQSSSKVSDLLAGNILQLAAYDNGFAKVIYPDGRVAYIPEGEVKEYNEWLETTVASRENILATAQQFLGRPYLWGGTSGKGIDCSGFTKTVFYLNGLMLPRDASQQVHTGVEVPTDTTLANLQPGDLLFFGRKATEEKGEKITHVAIYMGEGKIIHSSGQVRIESMQRGDSTFNEYRLSSFVRAKRMLPAEAQQGVYPLTSVDAYKPSR